MSRFLSLLKLDFTLMVRNRILHVAALITVLYSAVFLVLPENNLEMVLTSLIFTDPVMLGFLFTGVLVLFEKSSSTLQAIRVTPVRTREYLWSKALSLTWVAMTAALVMTFAGTGMNFQGLYLIPALILSSLLFIFLGFRGVIEVETFNQYFIIIPLFMIPGFLPFLGYFGIWHSWLWYLFPTHASLILFRASFEGQMPVFDIVYALVYLPLCIFLAYRWVSITWDKKILH